MIGRISALVFLEVRSAWRRPMWWVLLGTLFLLTWGLSSGSVRIGTGGDTANATRAWLNSQYNLAFGDILVFTLLFLFFIAVAFGSAIPDDHEHRTGSILHGTRLTSGEYILGRWLGVAVVALVVMGLHLVVQMGFYQLYPVDEPDKVRGPFEVWNFARTYWLFIALPSLCLGAFTFAIGAITRHTMLVFIVPISVLLASIFFFWSFSPEWLSLGMNKLLCVVDPTGFRWLNETWIMQDQGAEFYNTEPVGLDGYFWANRGWQMALGAAGLVAACVVERRRLRHPYKVAAEEQRTIIDAADLASVAPRADAAAAAAKQEESLRALHMTKRGPSWVGTMVSQARAEASELRRGAGLWIFVPLITLQAFGSAYGEPGPFNTPLLLTPGLLAAKSFNTVTLLSLFLLLFYATESLSRDDRRRMTPIIASGAASSGAMLVGKLLANLLVVMLALLVAIYGAMLIGLVVQLVQSGIWILPDPMPLVRVWLIFLLPTLVAWMGMIALVWSLTRSRYAVYGVGLALLVLTGWLYTVGWVNWVGNWHLWDGVLWSDFGSFELDHRALLLNRVMWVLVGCLLVQVALMANRRRTPDPHGIVSRMRPKRIAIGVLRALPLGVAAFATMVALALDVRAGGDGSPAESMGKAYRAANSETWRNFKEPAIADLAIDMRISPADGTFEMQGEYVLTNPWDEPIDRFALTPGLHFKDIVWSFGGAEHTEESAAASARAVRGTSQSALEVENSAGLWVFRPKAPLAKGETVRVGFAYHGSYPDGIGRNSRGAGEFILPSGVVLNAFSTSMLPMVGWVDGIGVDPEDSVEPRRHEELDWKKLTKPSLGSGGAMNARATVTIPEAYRANAPGVLESDTVADGWRTMVWATDHPVRFFNVIAGKWVEAKGESTSIWHLAEHARNVPSMLEALDGSREWYSKWFYPYPWRDLRVTEFPGLSGYAQGFATNIVFSESIGFLAMPTLEYDAPFVVTAHEAAHQWWGNILMPGDGPGGNILSEGLAHYSTARLCEQLRGDAARRAFLRGIEDSYVNDRVADEERPMVRVDGTRPGDTPITYDKGGWVFWMLKDLMGVEACDAGTRDFIERFKDGPDYPLLQDYTAVMREHAPDKAAFDAFVEQWFHSVVLPEFKVEAADGKRVGDAWTTTITVVNAGTGTVRVAVAVTNGAARDAEGAESADGADGATGGGGAAGTEGAGGAEGAEGAGGAEGAEGAGSASSGESVPPAYADERTTVELGPGAKATIEIVTAWEPAKVVVDPDVRVLQTKRKSAEAGVSK